ncbi:hypothetical protein ACRAWC_16385 [Leifsonia sp. L25]|uniref:hypothetical protein n=1 Tax=Actinomycetes TaxID=1760 RepID=UPI003D6806FB
MGRWATWSTFNTFYSGELSVEEWQRTYDIRFSYFPKPGPTATGILIGKELNIPGIRVEVNAVAVVGSAARDTARPVVASVSA